MEWRLNPRIPFSLDSPCSIDKGILSKRRHPQQEEAFSAAIYIEHDPFDS
jgi:hypothetical protein